MTWIVEGAGEVEIEIGAPRTGWSVHKLHIVQ